METTQKAIFGKVKSIISSPTTVWFGSLYFFGILSMITNNIIRLGFSWETIRSAPEYYAQLFFTYGLNLEGTYDSPWQYGLRAWIIAPFIAIWLGLVLFYLRDAGFAYNANTRFMDPFLPAGDPFYAFFSEDVYGAGELIFGIKGNLFYITIVWMPIIFASILTVMYTRRSDRGSWIVTRVFLNLVIGLLIAIEFAKVTDPNLSFSFVGLLRSLFFDRTSNHFVVYSGQYNPMMLTFIFALYQMVSVFVLALVEGVVTTYKYIKEQYRIYQLRQEYLDETKREGVTKLPWEDGHKGQQKGSE